MSRRTKFILAGIVLVAGIVLAWQFRKPAAAKTAAPGSAPADLAVQGSAARPTAPVSQNGTTRLDLFNPPAQPGAQMADLAGSFPAASDTNAHAQADNSETAAAPSAVPSPAKTDEANEFHTSAGAVTAKSTEAAVPDLPAKFSSGDRQTASAGSDFHADSPSDASVPQTHKIVDGDSLPLLAERYLGSANRAEEIFACNRDVLSDPELLPIGVRLRIPSGRARSSDGVAGDPAQNASSPPASPAASPPGSQSPIAVGTKPPLLDIGPSALSPLPPIGDQARSTDRIYIVQTGDTLSGIAQHLYGDGAKADMLLQANRDQLHSEQDLRAGMILAAP